MVEISPEQLKKNQNFLKKNNVFFEVIAEVQNDTFEIVKMFSLKTKDLRKINNQWYNNFNAIN